MTENDATMVLGKLRVLFPQWYEWLRNIETKQDTVKAWQGALVSCDLEDCERVMVEWQTGKRKSPEAFERERVVYLLVETARAFRNQRFASAAARTQLDSFTAHLKAAEARRRQYRPLGDRVLARAGQRFAELVEVMSRKRPRSQWTKEDMELYASESARIALEARNQIDGANDPD